MHNPTPEPSPEDRLHLYYDLPKADQDRIFFEKTAADTIAAAGLAVRDGVDLASCGTADLPAALDALAAALLIVPGLPPEEDDAAMRAAAVRVSDAYTATLSNIESLYVRTEKSTTAADLSFAVEMLRRGLAAFDGIDGTG